MKRESERLSGCWVSFGFDCCKCSNEFGDSYLIFKQDGTQNAKVNQVTFTLELLKVVQNQTETQRVLSPDLNLLLPKREQSLVSLHRCPKDAVLVQVSKSQTNERPFIIVLRLHFLHLLLEVSFVEQIKTLRKGTANVQPKQVTQIIQVEIDLALLRHQALVRVPTGDLLHTLPSIARSMKRKSKLRMRLLLQHLHVLLLVLKLQWCWTAHVS